MKFVVVEPQAQAFGRWLEEERRQMGLNEYHRMSSFQDYLERKRLEAEEEEALQLRQKERREKERHLAADRNAQMQRIQMDLMAQEISKKFDTYIKNLAEQVETSLNKASEQMIEKNGEFTYSEEYKLAADAYAGKAKEAAQFLLGNQNQDEAKERMLSTSIAILEKNLDGYFKMYEPFLKKSLEMVTGEKITDKVKIIELLTSLEEKNPDLLRKIIGASILESHKKGEKYAERLLASAVMESGAGADLIDRFFVKFNTGRFTDGEEARIALQNIQSEQNVEQAEPENTITALPENVLSASNSSDTDVSNEQEAEYNKTINQPNMSM